MAVQFKSYQQILGDMIRKMLSVTGLNDLNKGSVLATLLEAAAQEDFTQYGALIEMLDNYALDTTSGADLDKRAAEYGLDRLAATASSGFVTITDSTITKVSTGIYIGASPPIAGDTILYVNDASSFVFPGSIFIGRGTANFEGPIVMSLAPVNNGSHWTITLATPLSKNHGFSETVILSQGGDRTVLAGTVVKIPANNISADVTFKVSATQVLADGEDTLNNILVFATQPGSTGNAPIHSIVQFDPVPFNGAQVYNPSAFSNARDLETDQELRDRIKNYIQSLSRGTATAIISGVVGVADPDENKRVASASLLEPTAITEIGELFIDDGTGFEPTYSGQGYEAVISSAAGTEQFLQLGNYPIVKAQVEATNSQPYVLANGNTLIVRVNNVEETITFLSSDFANIASIKATDLAGAINNKSTLIEARTTGGQKKVVIFAKTPNNETIQVIGGTANSAILFPTDKVYTIKLYKNDLLLSKDGETAFIESAAYASWNVGSFGVPSTFNIQVDGKYVQYFRIGNNSLEVSIDGVNYLALAGTTFNDLGTTLITASVSQWVTILQQLIVGATVTVNGSKIKITSNEENSATSSIQIWDLGTPNNLIGPQIWPTDLQEGKTSDFTLNRFNGQVELIAPLVAGDIVTAGTPNTRASLRSTTGLGGTFDLSLDNGRIPQMLVVVDGTTVIRTVNAISGSLITVAASGPRWRYTSSVAAFTALAAGDYILVQQQIAGAWVGLVNTGVFRAEIVDPAGFYFEVTNPLGVPAGPVVVDMATDIQAFYSSRPPQRVLFTIGSNPVASVVATLNTTLVGAFADALDDDSIKLRTDTYDSTTGSIAIVAVGGNARNLNFPVSATSIVSHVAALPSASEVGLRISGGVGSVTTADTTDPYTTLIDASRAFLADGITQPNQWVKYQSSLNEDIKGIIRTISGATTLLLRDNSPSLVSGDFLGSVPVGALYQQYSTFDLQDTDNLVVIMDGDEINKTHNVPLSRKGRISAILSTTTFDALDVDANVAGTSFGAAMWNGYDFSDYKVWLRARQVIDPTNNKNAMIIRSKVFGPTGERIRISFAYNVAANSALGANLTPAGNFATITILLGTGPTVATTQDGTTQFTITTGIGTTTYTFTGGTNPGFAGVAVGNLVTFASANFSAGNNGTFRITATDNLTFVTVSSATGVPEIKTLGAIIAMSIFSLTGNTGTAIVNIINNTSPVNEVIDAILTVEDPFGTANDGSGSVDYSTLDDPAILSQYVPLVDSQNWVRDFSNPASPQFTLKAALQLINVIGGAGNIYSIDTTPVYGTADTGEPIRLIPATAKNLTDHFNKAAITSLSLDAAIDRSDDGERVQVASLLIGTQGQVQISGGLGNSGLMAVQGNAAIAGSYLKVPVLMASIGGFHTTQMVKISNQFTSKKINTFDTATTVTVSTIGATTQKYMLNKRVLGLTPAVSTITVIAVGVNRYRLTVAAGGSFSAVSVLDELQIPAGSPFAAGNEGNFPIVAVDLAGTYIEVLNPTGVIEGPITILAATDLTVAVPLFTTWPLALDVTTEIIVEKLSQGLIRFRWTGTGTDPNFAANGVRADDIVTIGGSAFSQANKGRFRIVNVTDDFFEVVNDLAIEETKTGVQTSFTFITADSTEIGDTLVVGSLAVAWFDEDNQGQLAISAVGRDIALGNHYVYVTHSTFAAETVSLGTNYLSFYVREGTPFETYRQIANMVVNPSDTTQYFIYITPTTYANRITKTAGSQIVALNKLGYSTIPQKGVDGYKYWTGLLRRVQRTMDGYDADPITYPGIKAAGVQIEVKPPLLQRVTIGVDVRTKSGTPLSILIDSIKSAVLSYITSLGVGEDVIMSQIVKRVQEVPGVEAVIITNPAPTGSIPPERIVIQDQEKAIAAEDDITVG